MQQNLASYFEQFLTHKGLFRDRHVLQSHYTPVELLHREEQTHTLAQILAPSLRLQKPSNIFIYGKTGTGKTVSVRFTADQILKVASQQDIPLKILYINCKMRRTADTEYRLVAHISRELGAEVPATGLPTEEVYKIFVDKVDSSRQMLILILDEIDELLKRADDSLLYNLTRLNVNLSQSQISIIGITNDVRFIDHLDARVRSSLGEEEIIFPTYNALQIQDILKRRTEEAFHEGVVEPGVVEKYAAYAARDHGDARRAIELLRVAGELAERNGLKKVTLDHLDQAEHKIEKDHILDIVRSQPKQFQLVVYGILTLWEKKGQSILSTGELYRLYKNLCIPSNQRPLTQRRVSDIIAELDILGLIDVTIISKGRYGRTREITPSLTGETAKNVKKLVAQSLDLPA